MQKRMMLSLALLGVWTAPLQAEELSWVIDGAQIQTPERLPPASSRVPVWRTTLHNPDAQALSVYVRALELGPQDYLVVRGSQGDEYLYTPADGADFWSEPVKGDTLELLLYAARGSRAPYVYINATRAYVSTGDTNAESYYGRDDTVAIAKAPDNVYAERGPVARLDLGSGLCTAFLISEDLMMTNHHCMSSQSGCTQSKAQFNYELDTNGNPLPTDEYRCTELLTANEPLDYAVFRVANSPGLTYGWFSLDARVPTGEQGSIIQHPNGRRKRAAVAPNCRLLDIADGNDNNTDFRHQCDTEGGSSGSPVLDANFNVVGLHHFGGATRAGGNSANQAVRMDLIVQDCSVCPTR
ncbi:MAG: trypsin-like serine peptidase [Myxococcota bacterium]